MTRFKTGPYLSVAVLTLALAGVAGAATSTLKPDRTGTISTVRPGALLEGRSSAILDAHASAILHPQAAPAVIDMQIDAVSPGLVDPGFPVDDVQQLVVDDQADAVTGGGAPLIPACLTAPSPITGDFNDGGCVDLVWRNKATGDNVIWNGNCDPGFDDKHTLDSEPDLGWEIRGDGDFGGFGGNGTNLDLVFRHKNGVNAVWHLDGNWNVKDKVLLPSAPPGWQIEATGDFNCDGFTDIFWRSLTDGTLAVWFMKNEKLMSSTLLANTVADQSWQVVGAGDFNKDNYPDLMWHNSQNGQNVVWLMKGTTLKSTVALQTVNDPTWYIGAIGDYNDAGAADLMWRNTATGQNAVWELTSGPVFKKAVFVESVADPNWVIVAPR